MKQNAQIYQLNLNPNAMEYFSRMIIQQVSISRSSDEDGMKI